MNWTYWIRQSHRWLSILFMVIVTSIFIAKGIGREPVQWVYFTPLAPLFLMACTGLYLFVLPYVIKARGGQTR